MTFRWLTASRVALLTEFLFMAFILYGVMHSLNFLRTTGFLPPPFFYGINDTFMDWFNTTWYAVNPGGYDVWRTAYPPLCFVFLSIFSLHSCYTESTPIARGCDWVGLVTLFTFFVINGVLIYKSYRFVDARTAIPRSIAMALGLPMLFTLDRGNLIMPTLTVFILGHSRLLKSARLKWIALALAINFKPYLFVTLIPQACRRRWRWFEGAAIALGLVYITTVWIVGDGTPTEIVANTLNYATPQNATFLDSAIYAASYTSILDVFKLNFSLMNLVGSRAMDLSIVGLPLLIRAGQIGVILSFLAAAIRPTAVSTHRLTALSVALVMTSTELGGYAEVFLLYLVFMERWKGVARIVPLVSAYILSLPFDIPVVMFAPVVQDSYLTGRAVNMNITVNVGEIVRPALVLLIEYGLVCATLIDVARPWIARLNEQRRQSLGVAELAAV